MPRESEEGNDLSVILDLAAGTRLTHEDIARVLRMSPRKFSDRRRMADFPNAHECWLAAEHYAINPIYLLATFGLVTREDIEQYVSSDHFAVGRRTRVTRTIPSILKTGRRRDRSDTPRTPTLNMRAITGLATRLTTLSVALWLAFTPIAHADTGSDFLNALTQLGIGYQDPSKTIDRGRVVCSAITTGGFSYTETVYGMARMSGSTVAAENGFAAVAVGFFCHDQEPLVMAAQSSFPPDARVVLTP